jgi:chromosome segregation ATPase
VTEDFDAKIAALRAAHIALGEAIESLPTELAKLQQEAQHRADGIVASANERADEAIAGATKEAARLRDEAEREIQALHAMHSNKRAELHQIITRLEDLELKAIALRTTAAEAESEHARAKTLLDDIRNRLIAAGISPLSQAT